MLMISYYQPFMETLSVSSTRESAANPLHSVFSTKVPFTAKVFDFYPDMYIELKAVWMYLSQDLSLQVLLQLTTLLQQKWLLFCYKQGPVFPRFL